jgi:hypothetical protein
MRLSKRDVDWLTRQARKLRFLWEMLNNPNCFSVMKELLKWIAKMNNCKLSSESEWIILGCNDYTVGISEEYPLIEDYANWLDKKGAFGVGIDIASLGIEKTCLVRLFKHFALDTLVLAWEYHIEDFSFRVVEQGVWGLVFIVSRSEIFEEFPPVEIYVYFDNSLNFTGIDTSTEYDEPVKPEEIVKAIIRDPEVRGKIEEAVDEAVTRIGKIYVPYLLY